MAIKVPLFVALYMFIYISAAVKYTYTYQIIFRTLNVRFLTAEIK